MAHLVGNDIAWILPPRTGTRYIKRLIEAKGGFQEPICHHHQIIADRIGDRKLFVNIRNPYTRLQSWWRLLVKWRRNKGTPPKNKFDHEFYDYLMNAHDLPKLIIHRTNPSGSVPKVKLQGYHNGMRYPQSISDMLVSNGVEIERIDEQIRMETFQEDLQRLGFEPNLPKTTGVGDKCQYDLKWYDEHPECVEIINRLYKDDFENFGYEMIKPLATGSTLDS